MIENPDYVALEGQVADLQSDLDSANNQISELEGQVADLRSEVRDLEASKLATEELAQEYKDALNDIESIASKHN